MNNRQSSIVNSKKDNLTVGAKGGAIAFILQISALALGFLNTVILARILGAGGIGEVILAISILNICALLAAFGMQSTMMRFVPFYVDKKEKAKLKGIIYFVLKFCLLLSIVFAALILLFSKFISINLFHSQGLLKLLPIAAVILPVYVLNDVIGGILRGYKDTFKALLPRLVVTPSLKIIIFLLLLLKGVAPIYAIIALLVGEIFAIFFSAIFLSGKIGKGKPLYQQSEYKKVLGVASTMIFTGFSVFLFTHADLWIVGIFTSTEDVGIYGVVAGLVTLISFSLGAFSAIIPPIMSSIHTSGDHNELRRVVRESTRWILSMSMPIVLIFVLEGDFILKYAYGERFADGYIALVILCIGQLINAGSGLVGWLLQMTGGHKTFMKITVFWGIINIILNIILVPHFGIIGAAISTAFCLSMVNIVSVWVIYNKLSVFTLAKGLKFDLVFAIVVAFFYFLFSYKSFYLGYHLLLISALIVYMWKSIVSGDLPLRHLLTKYKV